MLCQLLQVGHSEFANLSLQLELQFLNVGGSLPCYISRDTKTIHACWQLWVAKIRLYLRSRTGSNPITTELVCSFSSQSFFCPGRVAKLFCLFKSKRNATRIFQASEEVFNGAIVDRKTKRLVIHKCTQVQTYFHLHVILTCAYVMPDVITSLLQYLCLSTSGNCSDKETLEDRHTDMRCESRYVIKIFLSPASRVPANIVFLVVLMFLIFECPVQILSRIHLVSVIKCY